MKFAGDWSGEPPRWRPGHCAEEQVQGRGDEGHAHLEAEARREGQMMNSAFKMMNSPLEMMDLVSKNGWISQVDDDMVDDIFCRYDLNGDKTIDVRELGLALKNLGFADRETGDQAK